MWGTDIKLDGITRGMPSAAGLFGPLPWYAASREGLALLTNPSKLARAMGHLPTVDAGEVTLSNHIEQTFVWQPGCALGAYIDAVWNTMAGWMPTRRGWRG